eukprot:934484-Pyramimonas_sp.AAC.1
MIVHFLLLPLDDGLGALNALPSFVAQSVLQSLNEACVVDHGHRSSQGFSHITFSMKSLPRSCGPDGLPDAAARCPGGAGADLLRGAAHDRASGDPRRAADAHA